MSLKTTYENRPELLEKAVLSNEDKKFLEMIKNKIMIDF